MMREIGVAHGRADLHAAVFRCFDLIERQAADIEDAHGPFDIELYQIEQRGAACKEAHFGALLRSMREQAEMDLQRTRHARNCGDRALAGIAAAITDAVHHATGMRVRKLPVMIEDLL